MAFEGMFLKCRLDYEILNISVEELAASTGLTEQMLEDRIDREGWLQWFPQEDEDREFHLDPNSELTEGENMFELKASQFTQKGRTRLQVYQIAKQMRLVGMYTQLEMNLIEQANEAILLVNPEDAKSIQALAGVLQNLTKDISQLNQSLTLGQDSNGLPQLVIRDLSGVVDN